MNIIQWANCHDDVSGTAITAESSKSCIWLAKGFIHKYARKKIEETWQSRKKQGNE